jgi:hypothetical protein
MKLWRSINQDQAEKSDDEYITSKADAVQGRRMWDGNTGVGQVNPRRCDDLSGEGSDVMIPDKLV